MKKSLLCFVLPVRNEEESLAFIITRLKEITCELMCESKIICVDDSTDRSKDVAAKNGAIVLDGGNQGLGRAMKIGLEYAKVLNADYTISLDTDGQVDLNEIKIFYEAVKNQGYDLVLASRFKKGHLVDYPYPKGNFFGVKLLSTYLCLATKLEISDSHGGIRAMSYKALCAVNIQGRHTYVQESIVSISDSGASLVELPSRWMKRGHGSSRVVSSKIKYALRTSPYLFLKAPLAFLLTPLVFIYRELNGYWRERVDI